MRRSTNSPPRWNHPSMPLPQQFARCILCFILLSCICLAIVLCLPCIYLVFVLFLSFICLVFVLYLSCIFIMYLSCICQSMPLPQPQSDDKMHYPVVRRRMNYGCNQKWKKGRPQNEPPPPPTGPQIYVLAIFFSWVVPNGLK